MASFRHPLRALLFSAAFCLALTPPALADDPADLLPADGGEAGATISSGSQGFEGYVRSAGKRVPTSAHGEIVELPGSRALRVRDSRCNRIRNQKRRKKCRRAKQAAEQPAPNAPEQPAPAYGPWCGSDAYTDTNPVGDDVRRVKVIYARVAGAPLRFREYAPMIQSDVEFINHFFLQESEGTRTVRFDAGTSCGPRYVDVQIVDLPRSRAAYLAGDQQDRWSMLSSDLLDQLGAGRTNYLVYADDLYREGWATAMGSFYEDDSPLQSNASNTIGHGRAVLFGAGGTDFLGSVGESWDETRRKLLVHELLHTLGAVQNSAPHSTSPLSHCWDEQDVMCYQDSPLTTLLNMCPSPAFTIGSLDCNKNDYFDVTPDPGSYLAAHWNVADSAYLVTTPAG